MKIALVNAFPNLAHSAEKEFIRRCILVSQKLGHEAIEVATSDEIIACDPTFVIVTHEFVAKTTHHYTVGLLWSPTKFYKDDSDRVKAIRSWDLVVPINAATRQFARDVHFPYRHMSAVSDRNFYPSAPVADVPFPSSDKLSLAYVGVHWDGNRHEQLFRALAKVVDLNVYGPPKAWEFIKDSYRGSLPFDGDSVIAALNRHGAALAIHKASHIEEDTPSMRVFESCAAKCLVITDPLPSLIEIFGDSLSYVDVSRDPAVVARQIAATIDQHRRDPALHIDMVRRARDAFESKASLEQLVERLLEDVTERMQANAAQKHPEDADITVIVRCGSRPLSMVQRAVSSLAAQTYRRIGIVFARYAEIDGFATWLEQLRRQGRFLFVTDLAAPGNGVRSRTLWAGLRAVDSELFCMLDDDDELFPNHFFELAEVLRKNDGACVAYSGVIRQEEDGLFANSHERFRGEFGLEIRERRSLHFFDDFSLDRLLRSDNYIQSNAWLARRRVLTPVVLDDPDLEVAEDMYLYLLLASRCQFAFSDTVSAIWNWRSLANDNSMTGIPSACWASNGERLARRLAQVTFPGGFLGAEVLRRGRLVAHQQDAAPVSAAGEQSPRASGLLYKIFHLPRFSGLLRPLAVLRRFSNRSEQIRGAVLDRQDADYTIDFSGARLPNFIVVNHGFSGPESWGRWTDGPKTLLKFRSELPSSFKLRIHGRAFETNHQQPIMIVVGQTTTRLPMSSALQHRTYEVNIDNAALADSLLFVIPNPESPAMLYPGRSTDSRRLGIALDWLTLTETKPDPVRETVNESLRSDDG
jgi:hypothetical protein